jgi:hypothetical protein
MVKVRGRGKRSYHCFAAALARLGWGVVEKARAGAQWIAQKGGESRE